MDFIIQNALNENNQMGKAQQDDMKVGHANIRVIGVGGGGTNAVSWLFKKGIQGAEVIACNTDQQHLDLSSADRKILLGKELTRGLGVVGFVVWFLFGDKKRKRKGPKEAKIIDIK